MRVNPDTPVLNSRLRFLAPSLTDLIFILLLAALSYGRLAPRLLTDADVGWHIRNGENIITTHTIPRVDSFSANRSGEPWYSWEWLYDALLEATHATMGLNGVVFLSALIIAVTLALVFRIALRRGGAVAVTVVLFLICMVASSIHFLARPHVVSWLLGLVWFWILDRHQHGLPQRWVWLLPIIMIGWVNLHGGFVLGFVLSGMFLLSDLVGVVANAEITQRLEARRRACALGTVLAVSAIASLINPYGYKLHVHVYEYLSNRFYMQHIDEFRAPNLHGLPAQAFVLLLVVTAAGIWVAGGKLRVSEWLMVAFSAFTGLWAARNIPISSMLLVMVVAPLFADTRSGAQKFKLLRSARLAELEFGFRGHLWPGLLTLITLAVCLHGGSLFNRHLVDARFDANRFPVGAVTWMARRGVTEPIFSLDSWGGYFIYARYPDQKVLVDDRHDFYGEPYLREYLRVLHLEAGWTNILDSWGVNLIVFPARAQLSTALHQSGWKTVYEDSTAAVFQRP